MVMQKGSVNYSNRFFLIDNKPVFIRSGELHYTRVPKDLWKDRLEKMKNANLNAVATYVFWNTHERTENEFNFTDLKEFLTLCQDLGLYVIIKPGGYICAEWTGGGYPTWLIGKNIPFRLLDERYIRIEKRWHRNLINAISAFFYPRGPVIMYQIENEYFWNNPSYLLELGRFVRKQDVKVPIVTNESLFSGWKTELINTIDFYPPIGNVYGPIFSLLANRLLQAQNKPIFVMELMGGWFGLYEVPGITYRGKIYSDWVNNLLWLSVGLGANGINIYMFTGGTNFDYTSASYGKCKVTTSYDFDAAIGELGQLRNKYFKLRAAYGQIKVFEHALLTSKPTNNFLLTAILNLRKKGNFKLLKLRRKGKEGEFYFIINFERKNKRIHLPLLLRRLRTFTINVPSFESVMVPVHTNLLGLNIVYSSLQIFDARELKDRRLILGYCPGNLPAEITFRTEKSVSIKNCIFQQYRKGTKLILRPGDICTLEEKGKKTLQIFAFGRPGIFTTWPLQDTVVFSNASFVSGSNDKIKVITEAKDVYIKIPTEVPKNVSIDGYAADFEYDNNQKILSIEHSVFLPEKITLELRDVFYKEDSQEIKKEFNDSEWYTFVPGETLETYNIGSGFIWYRAHIKRKKNLKILFGMQDNAHIFVNGKEVLYYEDRALYKTPIKDFWEITKLPLKIKKGLVDMNLSGYLKHEDNLLAILVEALGHRNLVPLERKGITTPIVAYKRKYKVNKWLVGVSRKSYLTQTEESFPLIYLPMSIAAKILPFTSLLLPLQIVYKANFRINEKNNDMYGKKVWLFFEGLTEDSRVWLNGNFLGEYNNWKSPLAIDITNYLQERNELKIQSHTYHGNFGLSDVYLVIGEEIQNVKFRHKLTGELKNWCKGPVDDTWKDITWGFEQKDPIGWYKIRFEYEKEDMKDIQIFKLYLDNFGDKLLIFLNGIFIGRYERYGSQKSFYIPETLLKRENVLTIISHKYRKDKLEIKQVPIIKSVINAKQFDVKITY
ncbi:MAG: beta-galactosidase [Candidatus Odinarchaeota archaeon]|nr:beta-galactosidase [Candidatus Odinarchaeota archaeon]